MPKDGKNLTSSTGRKHVDLTTKGNTKPRLATPKEEKKITFSFAYFFQYPFFGLTGENANWFVSLIDRLKDLSGKSPEILGDYTSRKQYRIHPVDWNQPNIPIQRTDLHTVPKNYLDNDIEYPILQFTISRSMGRVAGFFDEESSVFYIVLLDPKHNLQPSKDHDYKVDDTTPLPTPYEVALNLTKKCSQTAVCPVNNNRIISDDCFRVVFYDTDDANVIDALKQKGISFHDAFCKFILEKL